MMSQIIEFYSAPPINDRNLRDIWEWDYDNLEEVHDYIQWLFPLDEPSQFNLDAPILTQKDIYFFNININLKYRLYKSFLLMLNFYGYNVWTEDGEPRIYIVDLDHWKMRTSYWATPNNHNYLRITRILRSMTLLGLSRYAKMFLDVLKKLWNKYPDCFGNQIYEEGCTLWYWEQACEVKE